MLDNLSFGPLCWWSCAFGHIYLLVGNNNITIILISNYHFQVQFAWEHYRYYSPVNDGNTSLVYVFVCNWLHTIIHCLHCLICFINAYVIISKLNNQSKLFGLWRSTFRFCSTMCPCTVYSYNVSFLTEKKKCQSTLVEYMIKINNNNFITFSHNKVKHFFF